MTKADKRRDRTDMLMLSIEAAKLRSINADLLAALQTLIDHYVANPGSKYEFISCITPGKRAKDNPTWAIFDQARAAIKHATEG